MPLFGGVEIPGCPDLDNTRLIDLLILPFIRKARRIGMAVERDHFHELTSKFSVEVGKLEQDISSYIPLERLAEFSGRGEDDEDSSFAYSDFNASSPEQIGKLLFDVLGIGTEKKLKRTKGGKVSTGKKQLEVVKLEHPVVPLILRHRELKTLIKNYTVKLPKMAILHPRGGCCPVCELPHHVDTWRIHGEMGTTRAETGRINHKNPNLGNVPTRTTDGQDVQDGFVATPGKRLVNGDLSQIELRGLAHLSNCKSMIDVYDHDGDIHDDTCHRALGVPWDVKPDKIKHRMAAKRVNFGIQNGTTEKGLYLQLVMDFGTNGLPIPDWLTEDWCKQFILDWLAARPEVVTFFEQCWFRARRYGLAWEPLGRARLIPEVKSCHRWIKDAGFRQAQNFPVTAVAAQQLKLGMAKVDRMLDQIRDDGDYAWPLLTIHDAIMIEADEEIADGVLEELLGCLNSVMDDVETGERRFRVPIKSDGEVMSRWKKG